MSKNVAVFVDVANIFYAAKAAGVDIDYVTLLKASTAGRDFVRAYAYTGLDPENENQRQFHAFLGRSGYKVISKDIRKYGDGRIKANLDIELVVDMMRMAQHIDIAVVVSGDGDFAPAIRAVQQMGVRVEVVSFRGNTSSDLIEVADVFTDISQLARVEKGERSGRRVASEDDLSMTAVPEKETDNGVRRRRGEGRTRSDRPERGDRADRTERPPRAARPAPVDAEAAVASGGNIIALPGERLSRAVVEDFEDDAAEEYAETVEVDADGEVVTPVEGAESRRRGRSPPPPPPPRWSWPRTRASRRGRGRDRRARRARRAAASRRAWCGRDPRQVAIADCRTRSIDADLIEDEYLEEEVATLPQHSTFGSVWESQIGVAPVPAAGAHGRRPGRLSTTSQRSRSTCWPNGGSRAAVVAARPASGQPGSARRPERPERRLSGRRRPRAVRTVREPQHGQLRQPSGGNTGGGNRSDRQPDRNRGGQGGRGPAPARAAPAGERRAAGAVRPTDRVGPRLPSRGARCPRTSRRCCERSLHAGSRRSPAAGDSASTRTARQHAPTSTTPLVDSVTACPPFSSPGRGGPGRRGDRDGPGRRGSGQGRCQGTCPLPDQGRRGPGSRDRPRSPRLRPRPPAKAPARSRTKAAAAPAPETGPGRRGSGQGRCQGACPLPDQGRRGPGSRDGPGRRGSAPKATRRRSTKSTASETGEG